MKLFKFKKKFTFVHFLILTFTLTTVIMFIAKNQMKEKKQRFLDEQNYARIFNEIILGRRLDFQNDTDTICKKADQELYDYYYTGKSEIDLSKFEFRNKSDQKKYIKALFDLIEDNLGGGGGDDEGDDAGGRRMEEEEGDGGFDIMGFAKSYGLHVIPGLLFMIIGIFSIFGWLICCCCACCTCCCKCCKKSKCKIPCLIISLVFNGLAIVASIIGLAKTNIFFTGIANTGCSVLQFINTIVSGEKKEELPKWIGVDGLDGLFGDIVETLKDVSNEADHTFGDIKTDFDSKKNTLDEAIDEPSDFRKVNYKLLTVAKLYDEQFLDGLKLETGFLSSGGDYIDQVNELMQTMKGEAIDSIDEALSGAKETINDIKETITSITDQVSTYIVDYSELIENYGKLGFKVLFGVFTGLAAILAFFIIIFFICSGGPCAKKCCCCHCFLKFLIVLFWNIAALLMVICFIIGGLLKLIGTIGDDLHVVISCILGPESLGEGNELIGDVSDYIFPCLHGDGDLTSKLNLTGNFGNISNLTSLSSTISTIKATFITGNNSRTAIPTYQKLVDDSSYIIFHKCTSDDPILQTFEDGEIVCHCFDDITYADGETCSGETFSHDDVQHQFDDINTKLDIIGNAYDALIESEFDALNKFNDTISNLTGLIEKYAGKGNDALAFLNCKFMGVNIKLVIHYIGEVIGKDIGIIGLMFILISCSMILVISGTILEMAIISISIKEKKEEIPEIPDNQTDVVNSERTPIKPKKK